MNKSTNKMAKVLFFLLLAVAGTAKAQDYQSFFAADSTRLNVYVRCIDFVPTFYLTINSTDVVNINGNDYYQGFPHGHYGSVFEYEEFYFREDVANGKLYRYDPILGQDILLCDMSLAVNDLFYYTGIDGESYAIVYSITYEDDEKVIHLTDGYNSWIFHEGIFPSYLPIGMVMDCESFLLCEYKNGDQVFVNPEFNSCYIDETSVEEQNQQQEQVFLYPNPAKGNVSIEGIEAAEVMVYNGLGQVVKRVKGTNEVCMEGIPQGIYMLCITDTEGKKHVARVMVKE